MEKLEQKRAAAQAAVNSLQAWIVFLKQEDMPVEELTSARTLTEQQRGYREALIQRFEYSTDTFLKYLKQHLLDQRGAAYQLPKDIVRGALSASIIDEQAADVFMDMIDDRNITSHTYLEKLANAIARKIPAYYKIMHAVLKSIGRTQRIN